MSSLGELATEIQNPGLGAGLVWQCTTGYQDTVEDGHSCPIAFLFLPLPLILHSDSNHIISHTYRSSGLRKFVSKAAPDEILSIHERVEAFRSKTMRSIFLASRAKLIRINASKAEVWSLRKSLPEVPDADTRKLLRNASKLGAWFAQITPHEIAVLLGVRF